MSLAERHRHSLTFTGKFVTRDDWEDPQMAPVEQSESSEEGIVEESLVEEVSIDGMCGVY